MAVWGAMGAEPPAWLAGWRCCSGWLLLWLAQRLRWSTPWTLVLPVGVGPDHWSEAEVGCLGGYGGEAPGWLAGWLAGWRSGGGVVAGTTALAPRFPLERSEEGTCENSRNFTEISSENWRNFTEISNEN